MLLTINGESRTFEAPLGAALNVAGLLQRLEIEPRKVAVERNFEIVPKSLYGATTLADGDQIEIVQFVGGG